MALSADLEEVLGRIDAKLGPMPEADARALLKDLEDAVVAEVDAATAAVRSTLAHTLQVFHQAHHAGEPALCPKPVCRDGQAVAKGAAAQ